MKATKGKVTPQQWHALVAARIRQGAANEFEAGVALGMEGIVEPPKCEACELIRPLNAAGLCPTCWRHFQKST